MNLAFPPNRLRLTIMLIIAALGVSTIVATAYDVSPASAAKKKKCKKGYYRVGKKCKRKPMEITPSSITLVAGSLKQGRFGATGYAEFPKTSRQAVLKGYWQISNGIGYERLKVEWRVAKGAIYTNFTDTQRKVGLTGAQMTAVLVVRGVQSNAQVLKQ